jgi:hypothetical protein
VERLVSIFREPINEELQKRVDVLSSHRAGIDGGIAVAVADIDGLVQKDHIRVRVPTVRVPCRILAFVANSAGTKLEKQARRRATA